MIVYSLDASALIRLIDDEPGADRVSEILREARAGKAEVEMLALHWGEVLLVILKRDGPEKLERHRRKLLRLPIRIVPLTQAIAERTAFIRYQYKIPHADAYGVDMARDTSSHLLVTADFDVKSAEREINIEFLPTKQKP